jgi:hypothetical protein
LRGAGLDIYGISHVSLERTLEWLNATTFDGSEVQSPFSSPWNADNMTKEQLLWMAAELNDGAAAARLVAAGADINSANEGKQTALHKAAMMGHVDLYCLGTLVALGADPFREDGRNRTALDMARETFDAGFGPEDAVLLLEQAMAVLSGQNVTLAEEDSPAEEESPFAVVVRNADGRLVPAPPPAVDRVGERGRGEAKEGEEGAMADENTKKKKRKKKYGSVRERWKALKEHRKKKTAPPQQYS